MSIVLLIRSSSRGWFDRRGLRRHANRQRAQGRVQQSRGGIEINKLSEGQRGREEERTKAGSKEGRCGRNGGGRTEEGRQRGEEERRDGRADRLNVPPAPAAALAAATTTTAYGIYAAYILSDYPPYILQVYKCVLPCSFNVFVFAAANATKAFRTKLKINCQLLIDPSRAKCAYCYDRRSALLQAWQRTTKTEREVRFDTSLLPKTFQPSSTPRELAWAEP